MKPEKKTEKRKKIEIIDKGDVYKPKKCTCKDEIDRFEPLTEEEQKDLLFLILDDMDFYEEGMEKAETGEAEKRFYVHYSHYSFFAHFLMKKHRDGIAILLKSAHLDRLAWEKKKKEEGKND